MFEPKYLKYNVSICSVVMYLNCSPSQLIVQFHGLQGGGSFLVGGGLEALPVVDHMVVLPCHLVRVLNDVAVTSKELAHVLGMDGLQIKVLHSPDLQVHSKSFHNEYQRLTNSKH